jgi:hypothetical protein
MYNIVTIKEKIKLYKNHEEANNIELISFEENGFNVVSQKGLYNVGDKAIYIEPDYNLKECELFMDFIAPNGDIKKSKLGSNNRIRAVKFNFRIINNLDTINVVYSQGILLPYKEEYINIIEENVYKYEKPENTNSNNKYGVSKSNSTFPKGLYRTDETNINKVWNNMTFPNDYVLTEKVDGSSITLWYDCGNFGVCSRNLNIPVYIKKKVGVRNKTLIETLLFWKKYDLNIYETFLNLENDFIKYSIDYINLFQEIKEKYDIHKDVKFALRGELNGSMFKGSGNNNNPSNKVTNNIKIYSLDYWSLDRAVCYIEPEWALNDFINWIKSDFNFSIERCKVIHNNTIISKEELIQICENYFKENLIEGIVVRSTDSKFSAKYMNLEYDSKK